MKRNDVYKFQYKKETLDAYPNWNFRHCFEGLLVVIENKNGSITLGDTFWEFNGTGSYGKKFTPEEAEKVGILTYYCNLDDLKEISKHDIKYYNDKDLFRITRQHGCSDSCVRHFISKDAK